MTELFDVFLNFDLSVFQWVQSIQSPFLTAIMTFVTTIGDEGIIFILLGIGFLFTKKYRKVGFTILAALVVMLICNNFVLKEIFARTRPFNLFEYNPEKYAQWGGENALYVFPNFVDKPHSFSFPSGHTSSAFTAAFAVLFYNRKIGVPMTFFAALMGFTRIYVEVHYCTDVLAGALVSILYAALAVLVIKLLYPKVEPLIDKIFDKILGVFKKKKA